LKLPDNLGMAFSKGDRAREIHLGNSQRCDVIEGKKTIRVTQQEGVTQPGGLESHAIAKGWGREASKGL
jgi:hypothetical protein